MRTRRNGNGGSAGRSSRSSSSRLRSRSSRCASGSSGSRRTHRRSSASAHLDCPRLEAGATGKRRFDARAWAQPLALLVLFALTALLAVTAYRLIFSTFDTPDDEGYLIVTLRSFAQGNALYDSVYSQ